MTNSIRHRNLPRTPAEVSLNLQDYVNWQSETVLVPVDADLGASAERGREWNTIEILAAGTRVDGRDVENNKEDGEETDSQH